MLLKQYNINTYAHTFCSVILRSLTSIGTHVAEVAWIRARESARLINLSSCGLWVTVSFWGSLWILVVIILIVKRRFLLSFINLRLCITFLLISVYNKVESRGFTMGCRFLPPDWGSGLFIRRGIRNLNFLLLLRYISSLFFTRILRL